MKDYIILPSQVSEKYYLYNIYQKEIENRADSLLNYQTKTYPFFRIINSTSLEDAQFFAGLSNSEESQLSTEFPTTEATLKQYHYVYDAIVDSDDDPTIPYYSFQILFVNELNIHQGVMINNDKMYLSFRNLGSLLLIPQISIDHSDNTIHITQELWEKINYKPSIATYSDFYLRVTQLNSVPHININSGVNGLNYDSSFAFHKLNSTPARHYWDFLNNQNEAVPDYNDDPSNFNKNNVSNLTQSYILFRDLNGNILLPAFSSEILLYPVSIGTVIFSNTRHHDIDDSLQKTLMFHLSDFSSINWINTNGKLYFKQIDNTIRDYGTNVVMPFISRDMRFNTTQKISPFNSTVGVGLYAFYLKNDVTEQYQWANEAVIVQPTLENNGIREELIGDFFYDTSVSKIENITEYHYTITDKNDINQDILLTAI